MNAPMPPRSGPPCDDAGDARELADFLAEQPPLDVQAALWATRRQDGLTEEEEAELSVWLAGDPARGQRLAELTGVLGQLDELPPDDVATFKATVPDRTVPPREHPRRPDRRAWLMGWRGLGPSLAMAGLAAMVTGGGWLGWHHWQQHPTFTQSLATARGQQLEAPLPDGSTLRLDTATRLDVALYRSRREVHLPQGQALFHVRADAERPFHVFAGAVRITVLGTRFSVRYASEGLHPGHVSVVVEEGRVRVARVYGPSSTGRDPAAAPAHDSVELTAGQTVQADAQGHLTPVTRMPLSAALAWREGRVVLNDTPLKEAVAEFERYLNTGLVIHDPTVAALRLNGSFDLREAHAFRRALPQVLPVRLLPRPDGTAEVVRMD